MKKTSIASIIGLLFSNNLYAANITENTSLALNTEIQTDEVVVTASRTAQSKDNVIADLTVINHEEIERAGQSTFTELLQTQPGIEIASNGGTGQTSSVFLRGTSSKQLVVLIDGIRVSSATAGTTTFENIPLALIEKIEILRGPATSLYGQDSIGGVIQIFTKRGEGKPHAYASLGYGSYNTKNAEAGVLGSVGDTKFSLNASSTDTDGFSALNTKTSIDKDRDGYRNLAVSGSISHEITKGQEIGIQILSSDGHSNYDGGTNSFNDSVDLKQLSYSLFSKNQLASYWKSTLVLGEGIDDAVSHSAPNSDSQFKTKQAQYSWQNDFTLPLGTLTLLYDRLQQRVISDSPFDQTSRNNDGYTASYQLNYGAHSFQTSYRSDHNSEFGRHDTGSIGYGFKFTPNWRASANYGTAFKAPTFNDAFYPFQDFGIFGTYQGNPNLKPEESKNTEASLAYENDTQKLSLTAYHNKIKNLILISQGIFNDSPINLGSVTINGLTLSGSQSWDSWHLKGSLDVQSPRDDKTDKLLARRANRHGSLSLGYSWADWHVGSELIASSVRYDDQDNQVRLAGYALLNFVADYKINSDWKLQGRLNNALNKDYVLATTESSFNPTGPAYNTPGSNLFVSVRWEPASK